MRTSSSLKGRVRQLEEDRGAGHVQLTFADGTSRGLSLSRNDRLKLLLASFDIASGSTNPDAQPDSTPGAIELARLIGKAEEVSPPSRLWDTVAGIVRQAEKEERECTNPAPEPASGSVSEEKK